MIRQAANEELKKVLQFLKPDVKNCIYMYTDIFLYDENHENIPGLKVWVEDDNDSYRLVVMKYHDSFSAYSNAQQWDMEGLVQLIREYKVAMVNARKEIIDRLAPAFEGEYKTQYGYIHHLTGDAVETGEEKEAYIATMEDIPEIAALLAEDEEYRDSYTKEELMEQFRERMQGGLGSSIIRRDGKIVAHCGALTNSDGIAVRGMTICHKDYRGQKLGPAVENHIVRELRNPDGSKIEWFTFVTKENRREFFEKTGNPVVARYGKLIRK